MLVAEPMMLRSSEHASEPSRAVLIQRPILTYDYILQWSPEGPTVQIPGAYAQIRNVLGLLGLFRVFALCLGGYLNAQT